MARKSNTHERLRKARHLAASNRLDEARKLYLKICRKNPGNEQVWLELAVVHRRMGALQEAEQVARSILAHHEDSPDIQHVLGSILHRQGRSSEAILYYRKALSANPDNPETHYFLANALRERGETDNARIEYQKTIALQADHVPALNNLSAILTSHGQLQEATRLLRSALQARPNSHQILVNLGRAQMHAGDVQSAIATFRKVVEMQPGLADVHSNLLACLNYLPDHSPRMVFDEHRDWRKAHAGWITPQSSWTNKPDPQRRLNIGYVSPDLHEHSVARFLEPVLAQHDHDRFAIYCYSDVAHPDTVTVRLRELCDHWRDISGLPDEQVSARVAGDKIDILVDLAGHTAHNRLLTFARKPAPLQLTWLGYPNTTGLPEIDFRLTDAKTDPPGDQESLYTETLVRLPHSFLCYGPPHSAPDPGLPPCRTTGHITFGSFNNLAKTTPEVVRSWSRVLSSAPGSRLLLKSRASNDPATQQRLLNLFTAAGISRDRIGFLDPEPSHFEHLAAYHQVDIALDTYPYHGTTTTCEALWMGVPVITRAGAVHAARVGVSLLTQVGLDSLVATGEEEYVRTAVRLAGDRERLASLHHTLRETMRRSSLCDAAGFTADLEQAYRKMWVDWCQ